MGIPQGLIATGSVLAVIVGCARGTQLARSRIENPGQMLFNGYTNAEVDCYRCHNGDGRGGGRGPDLSERVPELSDEEVLEVISEGAFRMPAFGDETTEP